MSERQIVEINGVKLEVDLRQAKTVEHYKVGDTVKVLVKTYGDTYNVYAGIIAGFDNFAEMPTITIAYLDTGYDGGLVKFISYNKKTTNVNICPIEGYVIPYEKHTVVDKFAYAIEKKEEELRDLKNKREFFLANFGKYFGGVK